MTSEPAPKHNVDGAWVEAWLSTPRFERYLHEVGRDRRRALELYEWNLQLGAALMRDIAHVDFAVRKLADYIHATTTVPAILATRP